MIGQGGMPAIGKGMKLPKMPQGGFSAPGGKKRKKGGPWGPMNGGGGGGGGEGAPPVRRLDAVDSNDAGGLEEEALFSRGAERSAVRAAGRRRGEPGDVQSPLEAGAGEHRQGQHRALARGGRQAFRYGADPAAQAPVARPVGSFRHTRGPVMSATDAGGAVSPLRAVLEVVVRALVDQPDAVRVTET